MYFHGYSLKVLLVTHNNIWPASLRPAHDNIASGIPLHTFKIVGRDICILTGPHTP